MFDGIGILVVVLLIVYIIFPLWAMNFASKHGRSGWAIAILLLSFIGLGPLVALLAIISAAGSPLETDLIDSVQRQCPNCGAFKVNGRRQTPRSDVYSYECTLCGYKWSWQVGTPWPQVTVRPELISAGEQKLEVERKRQAQRDAEGAYWLSQQNKK